MTRVLSRQVTIRYPDGTVQRFQTADDSFSWSSYACISMNLPGGVWRIILYSGVIVARELR